MKSTGLFLSLFCLTVTVCAAEDGFTIEQLPPSVVKTIPQAGDAAVDPSLDKISVTFSKEMMTERMWSVVQVSKEHFPKIRETPQGIHYLGDKRTCVIPVELQPNQTYVLWINRGKYNSFRDTGNNPSVPYLLVFHTTESSPKAGD